MFYFWLAI